MVIICCLGCVDHHLQLEPSTKQLQTIWIKVASVLASIVVTVSISGLLWLTLTVPVWFASRIVIKIFWHMLIHLGICGYHS